MRHSQFDSPAWHATIGDLLAADDDQAIADALTAAIGQAVVHDGTCLLAFHADAPPEVLHHTLGPRRARHYLDRYLAGPYLLDPLYALAINNDKPSMCRFRDAKPDRFHSSEYYKQYCDQTHLKDEMDFLVDVGGGSALAMVVGRREKMFSKTEDLLPVISFNPKSSEDDQRKHQQFVDRMTQKGYTAKQVRLLSEWYLRVRKAS